MKIIAQQTTFESSLQIALHLNLVVKYLQFITVCSMYQDNDEKFTSNFQTQ